MLGGLHFLRCFRFRNNQKHCPQCDTVYSWRQASTFRRNLLSPSISLSIITASDIFIIFAFLVNMPIFWVHLWLPGAHVKQGSCVVEVEQLNVMLEGDAEASQNMLPPFSEPNLSSVFQHTHFDSKDECSTFPETSVNVFHIKRCHIPEDGSLHCQWNENLNSKHILHGSLWCRRFWKQEISKSG